ncbi:MAG: SRPBCC domain-containing protein [Bacteroidetes bacterium]|nr:MAG: SRPBCC domain-containing protein [Bacteroidota bacterium]
MKKEPFIIERVFNASIERVWQAITRKDQMKKWYFDIASFRPEVGFEFQFKGGNEDRTYVHLCKVTEVVEGRKIQYSWVYDGLPGYSVVTWELSQEDGKTRVKLTHEGIETFPADNPDFDKKNFMEGWTHLIDKSLKDFLERTSVETHS